ncbi:MAG: hypothetical protein K6A63_03480 [Acholeplasmatales bacterium]|nr:hypothetical protein [Acholeplasmatales bacterium]
MKKLLSKMKIFHLILLVLSGAIIIAALPFKTQYNYIYVNVSTTVEASTKETLDDLENKQEYLFALFNMTGYDTNADGSMKAASTSTKITVDGEYGYVRAIALLTIPANSYTRSTTEFELATPYTYSAYRRVTITSKSDFEDGVTYYTISGSSYVEVDKTQSELTSNAYYVKDDFLVWLSNVDYFTKNEDGTYTKVTLGDTAPIHKVGEEYETYYTYKYEAATAGDPIGYVSAGIGGDTLTQFADSTNYYTLENGTYTYYDTTNGIVDGTEYYTAQAYYTQFTNGSSSTISVYAPVTIANYNRATDFEYTAGSFDSYKKQVYDFQIELNDVNNLILWFGVISLIGVAFLYFFSNNSRRIYYKSNIIISAIYTIVMVVFGVVLIVNTLSAMSHFSADSDLYNYVYVMQNSDINIEIFRDILGSSNPSMSAVKEYFSCNVATFIGYLVFFIFTIVYVVFVFILSLLKFKDTAERRHELEKVVAAND